MSSGRSTADLQAAGMLEGFVAGAISPHDCLPDGVKLGQLVAVVNKYVRAHPEDRHYSASSLVRRAVDIAFPCTH